MIEKNFRILFDVKKNFYILLRIINLITMLAPTLTKTQVTFVLPRLMSSMPNFEFVKLERRGTNDRVGLITLNRPEAMNALCIPLMADLTKALSYMDNDKTIGAVVLTGKYTYNEQGILLSNAKEH